MKSSVFVLITFLLSFSCSPSGGVSETRVNNDPGSQTIKNINSENLAGQPSETPEDIGNKLPQGSFSVDIYEDNKLVSKSFYRNGLCIKFIAFDAETKKKDTEIEYFYNDKGELDHQKVIQGKYVDDSEEMALENKQAEKDFKLQRNLLRSKGMDFPLADIVTDDISDLSNIYAAAENDHDFKTETQTDGNQKVVKFIGFNKTIRFHNSPIALLIGNGDFINIKDYELTLENGFPLKEIYRTNNGELTKTYSYKDGRLTGLVYKFTDLQNQSNSLEKRFEYHELNQKP